MGKIALNLANTELINMGCIGSREKWTGIEDKLLSACRVICMHQKDSVLITKVFHRYSPHFHLSEQQLAEALKELNLPFNEITKPYYDLFLEDPNECKLLERQDISFDYTEDNNLYSVKRLSALGALLGRGDNESKFVSLFYNYDIDASDQMSKWELNVLLSDILNVQLEIIPDMGILKYPDLADNLNEYKKSLMKMKRNISEYFRYLILEGKIKDMDAKLFSHILSQPDVCIIIHPTKLRKFIITEYEECLQLCNEMKIDDVKSDKKPKKNRRQKKKHKKTKENDDLQTIKYV
jgi:hypothetical protein